MVSHRIAIVVLVAFGLTGGLDAQEPMALAASNLVIRTSPDPAWLVSGARESAERAAAQPRGKALWKASLVALVAASAVDAHSSWGKLEANPLLANNSGRFGMQSIALKGIIAGGAVGAQWILFRHSPSGRRAATVANFAMAGVYAKVAAHNYGNSR